MKLRIKQLRQAKGWTQDDLAERSGISRSYLTELETGAKTINARRLTEVARALGVEPEMLIEREKTPVRIIGDIVEGARIVRAPTPRIIALPTLLPPQGIDAVEVVGNAMTPVYQPGFVIFFSRPAEGGVLPADVGQPCIIEDAQGDMWLKVLKRGSAPGLWNMICVNPHGENQWDREVSWAARIRLAIPSDLVSTI